MKKDYYHWAVIEDFSTRAIDFWRSEVVTTDMFSRSPKNYRVRRVIVKQIKNHTNLLPIYLTHKHVRILL
ncbi:MAG: hypothetical protein QMD85_01380, partial [Candidatus Aenigmarchaeota archaeon]|nr:hypothetical protein [Candidatus Aenigmarchaeota archaeon]MDI6722203.1 hypothetical protein [Candidatus Aenigmarchaeota archaeon]